MIDTIYWWVGALICWAGAGAAVVATLGLIFDYIWRRVWDFDAFRRVVAEANRQGVKLTRDD